MKKLRQPTENEKAAIRTLIDYECGVIGYYPGDCFPYVQAYMDTFVDQYSHRYHPRFIELVGQGHAYNGHTFQRLLMDLLDEEDSEH